MKILSITAQKPNSTGSGVYLSELVKEYAAVGHEQAVVAGVYRGDPAEFPEGVRFYPVYFCEENLPYPIVGMSDEMPYKSTRYCDMTPAMAEQFKRAFLDVIGRAVRELEPDLILCHHLYLLTAIVREHFPNRRVYGFCHNTDLRQMRKTELERGYIREQIKKLDHIFVPQKAQEVGVMEVFQVGPERITRLGMGYNSKIFCLKANKRTVQDQKPDHPVAKLIFAGKIAEKKGVISLLRAMILLEGEEGTVSQKNMKLYLAGGSGNEAEYERIRKLAGECPCEVVFLGRLTQQELAAIYKESDLFVLPSFFEGIPLVVIEALACGNRVVMTELPGVREWLSESVPEADIRYVGLPKLRNTDEPVPETLPDFERRLADALQESIAQKETKVADMSRISWTEISRTVLRVFGMDHISVRPAL